MITDSMAQAYWGKLARIRASDIQGHVTLFHWCIKHHLLSEAGNQLDVLATTKIRADHLKRLSDTYVASAKPKAATKTKTEPAVAASKATTIPGWAAPLPANKKDSIAGPHLPGHERIQRATYLQEIPIHNELDSAKPGEKNRKIPSLDRSATRRGFVPVDRFDPEIFNRQMAKQRKSPETAR